MTQNKFCSVILIFVFCIMQVISGSANELQEKRAEYDNIQQQMQKMEIEKNNARRSAEAASARMDAVLGQLNRLKIEMKELEAKRDILKPEIDKNAAELDEKKAELEERKIIYKQRLRDIYINGQINYLDVLLGAKDFSDFSSRMFLLQKIISRDITMLNDIMTKTMEIEARQKELNEQIVAINKLHNDLEGKAQRAEASRVERAELLYKAEEERRSADSEYDRLLAISENISSMLRSLERNSSTMPSGSGGTGAFMWPVRGEITSYYGWRTHPVFGTTRYHSGMDIACDYGTRIVAADSGTVIYSGWMGGYGYAVMIDHGGGLVTIYGHNQELTVNEGQAVNKGQLIAYAGSTGWSTGPHCHFEVRLHGEVTEPLNYLP